MSIMRFLHKAFIAPFTSVERGIVYLSAMLGQFGFYGLLIYLAFDLTTADLSNVISFFAAKFIVSNLLLLPFLFMILRRFYNRLTFSLYTILQFLAFLSLLLFAKDLIANVSLENAFILGLIVSVITEPFWAIYHTMMLKVTSDENRGHEVSMAELGMRIGVTLGSFAAGFMLTFMPGSFFLLFSAFCMIIPTIAMGGIAFKIGEPEVKTLSILAPYKHLIRDPQLTLSTILQGILNSLTSFFVPIWLKVIGFSAMAAGSVMAAQVIARLFVGPLSGHLYEKGRGQEISIGGFIYTLAWLPWTLIQSAVLYIFSAMLWAIYSHMVNVGLDSRWYANKTLIAMASREICFGIGRLLCCLVILPLLYVSPILFFCGGALVGIVFVLQASGFNKTS